MSKIQHGAGRVAPPQAESPRPRNEANPIQQSNQRVYQANTDSHSEKFNSREGIERARRERDDTHHRNAHAHNHHNKHRGDSIDVNVEGVNERGRVIEENSTTLIVLINGEIYKIDKKTGHSRGNRKATLAEIELGQQLQVIQEQIQQQEVRAQEQRAEAVKENIKVDNRKHEQKVVEKKKEIKLDEAQALERATTKKITLKAVREEHNDSTAAVYQVEDPHSPYKSLSVTDIILSREWSDKLKGKIE